MSVIKRGGMYAPKCDCCGIPMGPEYTMDDAITAMRIAGWQSDPKTHTDLCPYCVKWLKEQEADK